MNALELSLYCKLHDCKLCKYSKKECKDFMKKNELTPDTLISLLQWGADEVKPTYFDLALECVLSPTCMQCKYDGKYDCHCTDVDLLPYRALTKLFDLAKEVKNDNS